VDEVASLEGFLVWTKRFREKVVWMPDDVPSDSVYDINFVAIAGMQHPMT